MKIGKAKQDLRLFAYPQYTMNNGGHMRLLTFPPFRTTRLNIDQGCVNFTLTGTFTRFKGSRKVFFQSAKFAQLNNIYL